MFLGLVGVPTSRLSWEAFRAARAIGSATGALFTAAGNAAAAGIVGQAAAVAGAGAFGWFLGQKVLESLEVDPLPEIPLTLNYRVPDGSGRVKVRAFSKTKTGPRIDFENDVDAPIVAPIIQPNGAGQVKFGILTGNPPSFLQYGGGGADLFETYLEVVSITKLDGSPVPNLRQIPGPKPIIPAEPVKVPVLIPVPGLPSFPIVPVVVPNPANEPDVDDETREPGVIVQVPEYGIQFNFGLDGVRIDKYRSPNTEPFEVPKIPTPPSTPTPAQDPCPCPEGENKDEEIICRIKTLQKEILDDGFTLDLRTQGPAQCLSASGFDKEFRFLETSATQVPGNAKRISYPAPGVDTVFIGNIQFVVKGALTEPVPIRTTNQIVIAPVESTGYVVSGATGFRITAAAYLYTKKDYVDTCG
jgi:hypothetical protein